MTRTSPLSAVDSWNVATGYQDALGHWQSTTEESRAALHAAMQELASESVASDGAGALVVRPGAAAGLPRGTRVRLDDGANLAVDRRLPDDIPLGYHTIEDPDGQPIRRLVVTPARCHFPADLSLWGWSAQLYAVRSSQSWGIGDLGDLSRLSQWSAAQGAGVVLINPLAADTPVSPLFASPYSPSSRCFRNVLYIDVDLVAGAADGGPEFRKAAEAGRALNQKDRIDRDTILRVKLAALRLLWEQFQGSAAFDNFLSEQGELLDNFSRFCALAERFGRDWRTWPAEYQDPKSGAVSEFSRQNARAVRFYAWLQWLLDVQLAAASAECPIMQDLPIGFDPGGADAWMWQHVVPCGVGVGAPPDKYNPAGQNWGLATFAPRALQAAGYEPFIQTIRAGLRHAGGLRIDHVMGLFRQYWIPPGAEPGGGGFVHYPVEDLLGIIALESHRAGAYVVGEDLGTLDPQARKLFADCGILSYRVVWFEERLPSRFPRQAMAAISTHDLPTLAGLWSGQDERDLAMAGSRSDGEGWRKIRRRLARQTQLPADAPVEEAIRQAYRNLASAPCAVVTAALDDALAVPHRPNMPGTVDTWPNWSQPLPGGWEAIEQSPLAASIAEELNRAKNKRHARRAPVANRR